MLSSYLASLSWQLSVSSEASQRVIDANHHSSFWRVIRYVSTPHNCGYKRLHKDRDGMDCGISAVQFCYYRILNGYPIILSIYIYANVIYVQVSSRTS